MTYESQYCTVRQPGFSSILWGICMPSECTRNDIFKLVSVGNSLQLYTIYFNFIANFEISFLVWCRVLTGWAKGVCYGWVYDGRYPDEWVNVLFGGVWKPCVGCLILPEAWVSAEGVTIHIGQCEWIYSQPSSCINGFKMMWIFYMLDTALNMGFESLLNAALKSIFFTLSTTSNKIKTNA